MDSVINAKAWAIIDFQFRDTCAYTSGFTKLTDACLPNPLVQNRLRESVFDS
jgi:hypothetical protein